MRLIFTLSPGRCGTKHLATIMDTVPGVTAQHEPIPYFQDVFRPCVGNHAALRHWWEDVKLPAIYRIGCPVYVCTSHMFCKGFVESFLNLEPDAEAIVLTRSAREVALSLWRNGFIPARTETGLKFLLKPDDPGVILPLVRYDSLTDYGLCYWYAREIEARQSFYAPLFYRHYKISLGELMSQAGFMSLLQEMELPTPGPYYDLVKNTTANQSAEHLRHTWPVHSIDGEERKVEALIT